MSLVSAILPEAESYTVTRYAPSTWSKGRETPGATSQVAVVMCITPMSAREVQVLPEGLRNRQLIKCHATSEVRATSQSTASRGDTFSYLGDTFEVVQVEDRSRHGGYWRAVAARVQS